MVAIITIFLAFNECWLLYGKLTKYALQPH